METIQRITGWLPGSAEHSVIRVVDEGIEMEGVVLGGSLEEPFAIRYAVMAYPDGRCRGVTVRAIGDPILIELLADGSGGWTDDDGVVIRGLDGVLDVDLEITPVAHALTLRRLNLAIAASADVSVAVLDVLGGEIRFETRRFERVGEQEFRVEDAATGEGAEFQCTPSDWTMKLSAAQVRAVTT